MTPPDLEPLVDRALKALSPPRAPETLLPAVMAAARVEASRPWHTRVWTRWPRQWQAASIAALVALVVGGSMLWSVAVPHLAPVATELGPVLRPLHEWISDAERFVTAIEIFGRTLMRSAAGTALACFALVILVMMATSVAVGAAIGRVALGGVER